MMSGTTAPTIERAPAMPLRASHRFDSAALGTLPFLLILGAWALLPYVVD